MSRPSGLNLPAETDTFSGAMAGAVAATITLFVYGASAGFNVGFHDSAELALRAAQLGATHSPGAPLHTLTGYLLNLLAGDPAQATVILSVLAGCLCAGAVSRLIATLVPGVWLAAAGGVSYGLLFPIWANAVAIELYSLSILFVALAMFAGRRWSQAAEPGVPVQMALAYGLAVMAHFANILLLPAFLWLVMFTCRRLDRRVIGFLVLTGLAVLVTAIANVLLAANVLPFGENVADTLEGLLRYMSGAEHDPLARREAAELIIRIRDHTFMFARQFLYAGLILGLYGLWVLAKNGKGFGIFLALLCAINFGYFTLFGSGDYFVMVAPAYLVLTVGLVTGVYALIPETKYASRSRLAALVPTVFVAVFIFSQWDLRRAAAESTFVYDYTDDAFRALPENAIAIARWNEFTALNYYQFTELKRPDIDFILPASTVRHYTHGNVSDYLSFVSTNICNRSVVTNKLTDDLAVAYEVRAVPGTDNWKELIPADTSICQRDGASNGSRSTP